MIRSIMLIVILVATGSLTAGCKKGEEFMYPNVQSSSQH